MKRKDKDRVLLLLYGMTCPAVALYRLFKAFEESPSTFTCSATVHPSSSIGNPAENIRKAGEKQENL